MSGPPPGPDYIGPREGAQGFLERETTARPDAIRLWLSLSQQADQEWPYPSERHPEAWIMLRQDAKFEIRIEKRGGKPSHAPPRA